MTKKERYEQLVIKRKAYLYADGLQNPSKIKNGTYDCDHIGAWSQWQGSLDAYMLVIGQDWGDEAYFIENAGKDDDKNPTNENLRVLFNEIKIDIGLPTQPKPESLFFTNAILGIKNGGMSASVKDQWAKKDTLHFTKPLIDIIQPKIIITLGNVSLNALRTIFTIEPKGKLADIVSQNPINIDNGIKLFPFYHCGGLGLVTRKREQQKADWKKISDFI